jgi:hypothetical protein
MHTPMQISFGARYDRVQYFSILRADIWGRIGGASEQRGVDVCWAPHLYRSQQYRASQGQIP